MASAFSRFRRDAEDDLEAQVENLTNELAAMKKALSRRGSDAYGDARHAAHDFYGDLRDRLTDTLPLVRKRARAAEQVARENPVTTAVIGLAVVGLLAAMLSRR
ncbi:MAG: DUF883 family protein [Rhizobiaceae bacterium]|nr:DUF883 family protein [Rhizobiaceae bacterium]